MSPDVFRYLSGTGTLWSWPSQSPPPGARKLPAIVPMVVSHADGGWTSPVTLSELIDLDAEVLAAQNGVAALGAVLRYALEASPQRKPRPVPPWRAVL